MNEERSITGAKLVPKATAPHHHWAARDKRGLLYIASLLADCLAIPMAYLAGQRLVAWLNASPDNGAIMALAVPLFLMFAIAQEVQSVETLRDRALAIQRAVGALVSTAGVLILVIFLFKIDGVSRVGFATTFSLAAGYLVIEKLLFSGLVGKVLGSSATANLLLLDGMSAPNADNMDVVDLAQLGLWPDLNRPEMIDALSRIIASYDRVVIASVPTHRQAWATFLKGSDVGGELLLEQNSLHGAVAIGVHATQSTLVVSRGPLKLSNRIQKRSFDVLFSILALVFLAPLLLGVALAIRLESEGPVLFRQVRVGQGNRMFTIFKFRSMYTEKADADGTTSAGRLDPRVTKVGRFIRRTSIDELPQLFNVLLGQMSMVGPRPHALGSLAGESLFWEVTDRYWLRHALKPGITGLAQIRGYRGATDNREELEMRVRCDLEYLSNWSMLGDVIIIAKTFAVISHDKAY